MSMMDKIRTLRDQTGLGIVDLQKALKETGEDATKALELLKAHGVVVAQKRAGRVTGQGVVAAYVHTGRIGALVELNCETDFVAKTDDFKELAKELAMQVASMDPKNTEALLHQVFIKDSNKLVQDLVTALIAKTGENIRVGHIARLELGQP